MAGRGEQSIRLDTLDAQQLGQLKDRLTNELNSYARSGNQLMLAASKFDESRQSVSDLGQMKEGHSLLLPLTQSLYVNGKIACTDKVLIDIGTGYFVEMSSQEGEDYCKRKVTKLQESLMGVQQIMRERQGMLSQVNNFMQMKMQQAQQAGTASA